MAKKYKLSPKGRDSGVIREDGASIPNEPMNRHWQEYLQWEADGNTPDPAYTQAQLNERAAAEQKAQDNIIIKQHQRKLAIQEAIKAGDLPADYKDPEDQQ